MLCCLPSNKFWLSVQRDRHESRYGYSSCKRFPVVGKVPCQRVNHPRNGTCQLVIPASGGIARDMARQQLNYPGK